MNWQGRLNDDDHMWWNLTGVWPCMLLEQNRKLHTHICVNVRIYESVLFLYICVNLTLGPVAKAVSHYNNITWGEGIIRERQREKPRWSKRRRHENRSEHQRWFWSWAGGGERSRRAGGYCIAPVSSRNDFSMTPGMWSWLSLGISSVYAQAKTCRLGGLVFTWLKWPSYVN